MRSREWGGGRLVGSIRTRDARKDGACKHRSDGDERVVLSSDSLRVRTRSLKTSREGKRRGCVFLFLFFFFLMGARRKQQEQSRTAEMPRQ